MLSVAILAGGLATRLRPLTTHTPKSLLDVAGKPFIFHQLHYLARQGVRDVVVCVGHLGEQIEAQVGDGHQFGLKVRFSYDGSTLLGTGGALKQALPLLSDPFFVLYGDSYLQADFSLIEQAFYQSGQGALMTVIKNRPIWGRSNVLFQKGKLKEYDKFSKNITACFPHHPKSFSLRRGPSSKKRIVIPSIARDLLWGRESLTTLGMTKELLSKNHKMQHMDYGLGVLTKRVFDRYSEHLFLDLATVYRELSLKGELAGYEMTKRFYEIGSFEGVREADRYLTVRRCIK